MPFFKYSDTGEYFEKEKMSYIIKDNILNGLPSANKDGTAIIKDCVSYGIGGKDVNIVAPDHSNAQAFYKFLKKYKNMS